MLEKPRSHHVCRLLGEDAPLVAAAAAADRGAAVAAAVAAAGGARAAVAAALPATAVAAFVRLLRGGAVQVGRHGRDWISRKGKEGKG